MSWRAARVDTSLVESRVRVFADVLRMTRDCGKYPSWNRETVVKAFQWADHVQAFASSADEVQKRAIAQGIGLTGVSFVDEDPLVVLERPVETRLRAILDSPILTWLPLSTQVVTQTLESASSRIGHDAAVELVADLLNATLDVRMRAGARQRMVLIDSHGHGIGNGNAGEEAEATTLEHTTLALEILVRSYMKRRQQPAEASPAAAAGEVLALATREDLVTLRLLCRAVTLSPSAVACGLSAMGSDADWQDVYKETSNEELWDAVQASLRQTPAWLFFLEDSVVGLLANKDPRIDNLCLEVLLSHQDVVDKGLATKVGRVYLESNSPLCQANFAQLAARFSK